MALGISRKLTFLRTLSRVGKFVASCSGSSDLGDVLPRSRCFHTSLSVLGVTPIKMPSLSPTMAEGTIVKWLKKEGESFITGDALCEIQTDKAVITLDMDEDGILAKILVPDNTVNIKVGTLIALMVDEGEDWKNVNIPASIGRVETQTLGVSLVLDKTLKPSPENLDSGNLRDEEDRTTSQAMLGKDHLTSTKNVRLGPAGRSLLIKHDLDPAQISGSGPHETLMKSDILGYIADKKLKPVEQDGKGSQQVGVSSPSLQEKSSVTASASMKQGPVSSYVDIEITNMRRTIAKRLVESKTKVPHEYAAIECNIQNVMSLRKKLLILGIKISVNDVIVKSVVNALMKCPAVNVVWKENALERKDQIDISVAVSTPTGLITPIVTDVAVKDILQISKTITDLAIKARQGKLQPNEFMGGSFTISNLWMFGIHHFTAIINPPQCAILAVGGPIISLDEVTGQPLTSIDLTLSYDANAISSETAARFLACLKNEVETSSENSMGIFNRENTMEMF